MDFIKLYFGDLTTIVSTLMVLAALGYIIYTAVVNKKVEHWGRRILALGLFGLVLCCFVATRDDYVGSVRQSIDGLTAAGIFSIDSIQSVLCCIFGGIIAVSTLSSIFVKNQKYRKAMFFLLGGSMIAKTLIIEISRLAVL